jgi:alpha-amylase
MHPGTLAGAARRLDYLADLGVDAIWAGPAVKQCPGEVSGSTGYHGYWAQDIDSIEPHIGSEADLRRLSDQAHGRGAPDKCKPPALA